MIKECEEKVKNYSKTSCSSQLEFTLIKGNFFCKDQHRFIFNFSKKRAFKWFAIKILKTLTDLLNTEQFYIRK